MASLIVTLASLPTGIGIFIYIFVVLLRRSVEPYDGKVRVLAGIMVGAHVVCFAMTMLERADWLRHRSVAKAQIVNSNYGPQTDENPLVQIRYSFKTESGASFVRTEKLDARYVAAQQAASLGESRLTAGNSVDVYYDARNPARFSLLEYPNDATFRMLVGHTIFGLLFGTFFFGYFFYARYVRALPPYVPSQD